MLRLILSGLGILLLWVQVFGEQARVSSVAMAGARQLHVLAATAPLLLGGSLLVAALGWELRATIITDTVSGYYARRRFIRNASFAIIALFILRAT